MHARHPPLTATRQHRPSKGPPSPSTLPARQHPRETGRPLPSRRSRALASSSPHPVLSNSGSRNPLTSNDHTHPDFPPPLPIPRKSWFCPKAKHHRTTAFPIPGLFPPPQFRVSLYTGFLALCSTGNTSSFCAPPFSLRLASPGGYCPAAFSVDFAPRPRSETTRIERRRDNVPLADSRTGCQQQLVLLP